MTLIREIEKEAAIDVGFVDTPEGLPARMSTHGMSLRRWFEAAG